MQLTNVVAFGPVSACQFAVVVDGSKFCESLHCRVFSSIYFPKLSEFSSPGWYPGELAMENPDRTAGIHRDVLVSGLHDRKCKKVVPIVSQ